MIKMMKMLIIIPPALVVFALTGVAAAQSIPATFGDPEGDRHISKFFVMPKVDGDYSVMLRCYAVAEKSGKLKDLGCYNSTEVEYAIMQAMEKATKKTRVVPASIGGKERKVYLQFGAEFIGEGDKHTIQLFLNPAEPENIEAYGPEHIAAQRVIGKEQWQKICPTRAQWLIYARAHVSVDGKGSSVDLAHGAGIVPTGSCQNAIRETVINSEFIPAMVDGEVVPSAFIEGFGN
jgi:hypothetical protein